MKKLLLVALLMLALVITAVACNNEPADTTAGETTATQTPATAEPEDSTASPETPTEAPEVPTEAPEVPTEAPEVPTEAPEVPTQAPVVTTEPVTEAPVDPMAPINVFEAADIQTITGGDPKNLTQDCVSIVDNYLHIVPIGADPYWYPFASVDGGRYVAIRYRTDATGADMQLYIASSGNGPTDDTTMIRLAVVADGEWNLAVFDTQSLIDAGKYDGEYVSYFRFDPLEAGYLLNENGETYKNEDGSWARHTLPEGCYIDVEYIAFFNSVEAAEAYDFELHPAYVSKEEAGMVNHSIDSFLVNEVLYFQPDGGHGDKLTAQNNIVNLVDRTGLETITLRGWIGFGQPIDSFGYFVDNYNMIYAADFTQPAEDAVLGLAGEHASRFHISVPVAALEAGAHKVGFVVKLADGTVAILRDTIQVILPWTAPVHTDETVELGVRGNGGPFNAPSEKKFGQRFNIGENFLKSINITDMATYANNTNTWAFRIWAWNTDYATTTAADPIAVFTGKDHPDNTTFTIDNLVGYGITGDFFYEIEYVEGTAGFTGWTAEASVAEGVETYVSGNLATGAYSSTIVVGVPGVADVTVDGDFADWADKVVTDIPVSKFIAWTGTAPESFNLKTSFTSDGEYLYVYLNPGENSGVTMYQICLITDNTVATDAAQAWYNVTFADGAASIAGVSGACKGEAKVFLTGTEVEAAIPIAAIYGEGFALPVETRILLVAQINGGTHMGTFHDGKNPNDDGWADRTGDGCPLTLNADGTYTIDLPKAEEPEEPEVPEVPEEPVENYNVPQDQWTVSGHCPQIVGKEGHGNSPMVAAGGVESGALLHQGAIALGEIDLSKYSKVVIHYGVDNSDVTWNHYNASANNRIMLVSADTNMTNSPADGTVIAGATYEPCGWAVQAFEIDLTGVDYNGPVFVTYDTLPGTFMLFSSVEFIA